MDISKPHHKINQAHQHIKHSEGMIQSPYLDHIKGRTKNARVWQHPPTHPQAIRCICHGIHR
jgi:hypothetical protein